MPRLENCPVELSQPLRGQWRQLVLKTINRPDESDCVNYLTVIDVQYCTLKNMLPSIFNACRIPLNLTQKIEVEN
jgi:hypothetical protein